MNNTRISHLVHENTAEGRRNIGRQRPVHTEVCFLKRSAPVVVQSVDVIHIQVLNFYI